MTKVHDVVTWINSTSQQQVMHYKPNMRGRMHLKPFTLTFFSVFFAVHFVAKRYILQQKCLNLQIGNAC